VKNKAARFCGPRCILPIINLPDAVTLELFR